MVWNINNISSQISEQNNFRSHVRLGNMCNIT